MRMVDIIQDKVNGKALSKDQIEFFIKHYTDGSIPDYQASALLMAILFQGMNEEEISLLTENMEHSGGVIDLSPIKGIKVDKHSTGGVGDKTSLVLGPMVAACGGKVAKMSGRGLGHTGGTLDKLESIPGLSVNKTEKEMIDQVNKISLAIIGQSKSLVPADKKLYALRDVTATVQSIPLIASSIMSKKLASGTDSILLDVTVGNGAFMKNIIEARKLASLMVKIGNKLGRNTVALLSDMSEPLGMAVGNSLEVKEAIDTLHGHGPKDLLEVCLESGAIMLKQAKITKTIEEGREKLLEVIKNGKAFEKFVEMVKEQGGDISYIKDPNKFPLAKYQIPLYAKKDGYINKLDALAIGIASMKLGGGREMLTDTIDNAAGIILNKKIGAKVKKGDLLATLHTNKENVQEVINNVENAFEIVNHPTKEIPVILEVIR